MFTTRRIWFLVLGLALLCLAQPAQAKHCPFCNEERGPTLIGDFSEASMVLVGTFTNSRPNGGEFGTGTTDFKIERVLKENDFVRGKNVITISRNVPVTDTKFLIFCDLYKGTVDAYRGVPVQNKDLVEYLSAALKLKDRPAPERLRLCFDYLQSPDLEVSLDAYREFAKADYDEYKGMAKHLPADKIASWLLDPATPSYRYGLYASLLGHCGNPKKHGTLLRTLIDDPQKRISSGIDGMLASYVMLQPKNGWEYLRGLLKNDKEDFGMRYAALRTIRFLWGQRADLVPQADLVEGVALVLNHPDMADFAVEDLRKWKRWEMTDRVLKLFDRETENLPVVRRSILRFALQCPEKRAAAFVAEQRRRDPEWVSETEELLRLQTEATPPDDKK